MYIVKTDYLLDILTDSIFFLALKAFKYFSFLINQLVHLMNLQFY